MDWQAIGLSVRLSVSTTLILLAVGLPLAYWLTFSRARWKFLVEAVVALPLVLPPTVLGFYVLLAIGPRSPVGALYAKLTGGMLPFSFQGLLLASVLYSLPFTVQPVAASFAAVDPKLMEASWCLGVSRSATFRRVLAPLALPGIATGAILSYAHTMGEFGVVLMVGGNIAGVTRTVSISIYDQVQALNYGAAAKTSLFLLCFSFTVLVFTYSLQRRMWTRGVGQALSPAKSHGLDYTGWQAKAPAPRPDRHGL
jgi:molybdate transport system permease protein